MLLKVKLVEGWRETLFNQLVGLDIWTSRSWHEIVTNLHFLAITEMQNGQDANPDWLLRRRKYLKS